MKEDIVTKNADEAFDPHTVSEHDENGRNPREFRLVARKAVDHDKREEVGKVEGIKSYHCFRTIDRDDELHMAEVSCFCDACFDSLVVDDSYAASCKSVLSGARAVPIVATVLTEAQRARQAREGWHKAFVHGRDILRQCQQGYWVLVYFDPVSREHWNEWAIHNDEPSWAVSGMYKVAEIHT